MARRWHRSDRKEEKKKRGRHRLNGRKAEPDEQTTEQTGSNTELQCSLRWIDHLGGRRGEQKRVYFCDPDRPVRFGGVSAIEIESICNWLTH